MPPIAVFLARRIPWTEEAGGLQSTGSQSRTRLSDYRMVRHRTGGHRQPSPTDGRWGRVHLSAAVSPGAQALV